MSTEPEWTSDDPQRWETYWASWYGIVGAKPVRVSEYERTERAAIASAEAALKDALDKVIDLGLQVEASCWTVKHRHRKQTQQFEPSNLREYVTTDWYGRLTQVRESTLQSAQAVQAREQANRG